MSYYVFGSKISYSDYLTGRSFVHDITSATDAIAGAVSIEISRQAREVIASNECLARNHIQVVEASTDRISQAMAEGFEQLSYGMKDIADELSDLNATFHWGFGEVIARLGHMNDALKDLIQIAKTPVQTIAFEHFSIARDAYRRGWYQECFEELDKAIFGDHTSAGYKLEYRFHQMRGALQLGFVGGDLSLVDLPGAEQSFLLATRYARPDYPQDAARAALSAGWAAYCQGKMAEALAHTELSLTLSPELGEALFQSAKVRMSMGDIEKALPALRSAIELDRFYALKAMGDGDFQKFDGQLLDFLEALRVEKYGQCQLKAQATLDKIAFWRTRSPDVVLIPDIQFLERILATGSNLPVLDLLTILQDIDNMAITIENHARQARIFIRENVPGTLNRIRVEIGPVKETFQEKVVIERRGFFRRDITETRTRTRTVIKPHDVSERLDGFRLKIMDGMGEMITSLEFVGIPAGSFSMGTNHKSDARNFELSMSPPHNVHFSKDFWIGATVVTECQWWALMGDTFPEALYKHLRLIAKNHLSNDYMTKRNLYPTSGGGPDFKSHFEGIGMVRDIKLVGSPVSKDLYTGDLPFFGANFDQANIFIQRLNHVDPNRSYRLPSEAEWEYACRAGNAPPLRLPGEHSPNVRVEAHDDYKYGFYPVRTLEANSWGLFDLISINREFCEDTWHDNYQGAPNDGSAWVDGHSPYHVTRNGFWGEQSYLYALARGSDSNLNQDSVPNAIRVVCETGPRPN